LEKIQKPKNIKTMKKFSFILSAALMMGAAFMNTSCEGILDNDTDIDQPEEDAPGVIDSFSVTMDYTSAKNDAASAFDADTKRVVSNNDAGADMVLCWQSTYGYIVTQPAGKLIKELYSFNNVSYTNSNTCTIQNLGNVSISDYADKLTLSEMSPKAGSIENLSGTNQVVVNSGDVLAFKTNKGTIGVAKVSGLSKFSKKVTLTGYVYYPNSAR